MGVEYDKTTTDKQSLAVEILRAKQLQAVHKAEANGLGAVGVPPLRLSDDELRARSPRDLEMFTLLHRTFKQRVRALEDIVGARVWDCKVHGRPHGRPHGRHLADTLDAELVSLVNASLL